MHRQSVLPSQSHTSQSSTATRNLETRISLKRTELQHLRTLLSLSSQLSLQMEILQQKLSTLNDGVEAVAMVLGQWEGVLSAISMASAATGEVVRQKEDGEGGEDERGGERDGEGELPVTLVRIPVGLEGDQNQKGDEADEGESGS